MSQTKKLQLTQFVLALQEFSARNREIDSASGNLYASGARLKPLRRSSFFAPSKFSLLRRSISRSFVNLSRRISESSLWQILEIPVKIQLTDNSRIMYDVFKKKKRLFDISNEDTHPSVYHWSSPDEDVCLHIEIFRVITQLILCWMTV